jgi:ABC-type sugar transport system ATPase subunit
VTCQQVNGTLRLQSNDNGAGIDWLAPGWLAQTKVTVGQSLTVGLRPQTLQVGGEMPNKLSIHVDVVEYLGTESQLAGPMSATGGPRYSAIVAGDAKRLVRQKVDLCFDADSLHVFDRSTGLSLRP